MNLIQILTAFVIAYLEGTHPVKGLSSVLVSVNRKFAMKQIPELAAVFRAYDNGEELDWLALAEAVKAYAARYAQEPKAKSSFLKVLRVYANYYRTTSDTALKSITKLTGLMEDDYLQGYFQRVEVDQTKVLKQLSPLVKRLGGTGFSLTLEQSKEAKENDPALHKDYLGLLRQFNEAWKAAINNYVRKTGNITVPIGDAIKHLKSRGIEHSMPTGFTGRIDAHGNWYTIHEEKINGGAPSATMFPQVKMNPAYSEDSPWVFQAICADGSQGNYFYTEEFRKAQSDSKFEKVSQFDVKKTRKNWLPLLRSFKDDQPTPQAVAATILEILFRTSNRIGKPGGNSVGGGFGIATLHVTHFYPQPDGSVKFIYLGKDSVKTVAFIKKTEDPIARKVCEIVHALAEGKKPSDALFTYGLKNGSYKPVLPGVVNQVFNHCTGGLEGVTVHKLRTVKGTELFQQYLDTLYVKKPRLTQPQVLEHLKKAASIVGKQLNHVRRSAEGAVTVQPMTSLKNYIDPRVQVELFMHYGCPIPAYLEKLLGQKVLASVTAAAIQTHLVHAANEHEAAERDGEWIKAADTEKSPDGAEGDDSEPAEPVAPDADRDEISAEDQQALDEAKLQAKVAREHELENTDTEDELGSRRLLFTVLDQGPEILED